MFLYFLFVHFKFLQWFVQDFSAFVIISFIRCFQSFRWFVEDLPKVWAIFIFNPFIENKWYAKSAACHQFKMVKDTHNVILIFVSSKWLVPYSRGSSKFLISVVSSFLFRSSKFPLYLVAKLHLIFARFHFVFSTSLSSRYPFVTGVLHGDSTWWFLKDLIPSRSFHRDSFLGSSSILHLAIRSAILSSVSLEVVLCHSW